ncbi:bactofilin family protein [Thiospirillum jenense]|uniref:Polymer-forming cytoskeletal protein n=1 Tax=Thiospirillum jenense TaxID=1653858 RepID=A0A839HCF0_9GAMM|nr:polymer-forming cytoskeletal protein [Thiospirillum jenense]MBB1125096.1 polymer-forming cytoskeletal protein [Thiospirillum jenense]
MASTRKFKPPKIVTVIGPGTLIKGDILFAAGLHVDGVVHGNINGIADTLATLTLSDQGEIVGEIRVDNLIINGRIHGDVYAGERLELAPGARITGTVYYRLLEMAMGAEVNGQLVHADSQQLRRLSYDGPPISADTESSIVIDHEPTITPESNNQ